MQYLNQIHTGHSCVFPDFISQFLMTHLLLSELGTSWPFSALHKTVSHVSFPVDQLGKFKVYASNDATSFNSPANLCHVSTRERSLSGDWMRLRCKKIFTSRYVFVQADAKVDNSNRELTICEMKASGYLYLITGKQTHPE